ncbi:MAG: hypothetical protein FWF97_02470 [Alphaproteobacteria bacterium]|nr:hypothetical protein [Alphaproteobacteria bacterium]
MKKLALIGIFALLPFVASADDAAPVDTVEEVVVVETVEESTIQAPDEAVIVEEVSFEVPAEE